MEPRHTPACVTLQCSRAVHFLPGVVVTPRISLMSGGLTNSSEEAEGWGDDEEFGALEDPEEKEAQDRLRRLNMRSSTTSGTDLANSSRATLERHASWDSESSLASSHSRASNMTTGMSLPLEVLILAYIVKHLLDDSFIYISGQQNAEPLLCRTSSRLCGWGCRTGAESTCKSAHSREGS